MAFSSHKLQLEGLESSRLWSVDCIATSYELEGRGFEYGLVQDIFSSPKCPYWLWGSPSLVFNGYLYTNGQIYYSVALTQGHKSGTH
jgi:hypothetical protein